MLRANQAKTGLLLAKGIALGFRRTDLENYQFFAMTHPSSNDESLQSVIIRRGMGHQSYSHPLFGGVGASALRGTCAHGGSWGPRGHDDPDVFFCQLLHHPQQGFRSHQLGAAAAIIPR